MTASDDLADLFDDWADFAAEGYGPIDWDGFDHDDLRAAAAELRSLCDRAHLLDDLDAAARRLEHLTNDDRWHHPSTPRAVRIAIDDIVDTITRMREG